MVLVLGFRALGSMLRVWKRTVPHRDTPQRPGEEGKIQEKSHFKFLNFLRAFGAQGILLFLIINKKEDRGTVGDLLDWKKWDASEDKQNF